MDGNTSLKLSSILEVRFTDISNLEKRIHKILEDENNDDDDDDNENEDADYIENKIKKLIEYNYETLRRINQMKRIAFWNELNAQLQRLPRRCITRAVESQMALLKLLCGFDFTQKPLSFASDGIHNLDMLTECKHELLRLIDKLREDCGLVSILESQYETIRKQRCKIVLAAIGGLKAGKSSFINYLLELDLCPVGIWETTGRLTKIIYGEQTLVKLESPDGELKELHEIHNDEQLKEVTKKLIVLEGGARQEDVCKDIVTIQLDRKELENIELWDIPGFDENPFLNAIVEKVLKETNIFFILTSVTEAVRETTVNLFRSCLKQHRRPPEVCFIVTKIDQVTTNLKAETTLENVLAHQFCQIQERFQVKLGDEWKSSPFFIPLCTDRKHSLKDFLDTHKQFTGKLMQFFTHAVRYDTLCYLEDLIDTIHDLLDYDDLDRSVQRDEKLSNMMTANLLEFDKQITRELKTPFTQIHQAAAKKASTVELEDNNALEQTLANEIVKELQMHREKIEQGLFRCINELYSKLEVNPALTVIIRSLGRRRLYDNPYECVIGQYIHDSNGLRLLKKIYDASKLLRASPVSQFFRSLKKASSDRKLFDDHNLAPGIVSLYLTGASVILDIIIGSVAVGSAICTDQIIKYQVRESVKSSAEIIIKGIIEDISNGIRQTLCEQLNDISEDIRRRKQKLNEQKGTDEARYIAKFLKTNTSSIVQLYLNLLDTANRFEYPYFEINRANELGRSNFPVFAGELGDIDRKYTEKIAAKRVSLESFIWQEVRYMRELKHENILHYYGVRKNEDFEDHYDILMQRLDANLIEYIKYKTRSGRISDKFTDDIFTQITRGLDYLHKQGLIHRDVKPENVLVQLKNNVPPVFVLADFGFINRVPISIKGTPDFFAPEVLVNDIDRTFITAKVDIYALGVTIQQTIDKSGVDTSGKYAQFWTKISQHCLLVEPFHRPTCQQIIEQHDHLNS